MVVQGVLESLEDAESSELIFKIYTRSCQGIHPGLFCGSQHLRQEEDVGSAISRYLHELTEKEEGIISTVALIFCTIANFFWPNGEVRAGNDQLRHGLRGSSKALCKDRLAPKSSPNSTNKVAICCPAASLTHGGFLCSGEAVNRRSMRSRSVRCAEKGGACSRHCTPESSPFPATPTASYSWRFWHGMSWILKCYPIHHVYLASCQLTTLL